MTVETRFGLGRIIRALLGRKPRPDAAQSHPARKTAPRRPGSPKAKLPESCELRDIGSLVL